MAGRLAISPERKPRGFADSSSYDSRLRPPVGFAFVSSRFLLVSFHTSGGDGGGFELARIFPDRFRKRAISPRSEANDPLARDLDAASSRSRFAAGLSDRQYRYFKRLLRPSLRNMRALTGHVTSTLEIKPLIKRWPGGSYA